MRFESQRRLILTFSFGWDAALIKYQPEQRVRVRIARLRREHLPRDGFRFFETSRLQQRSRFIERSRRLSLSRGRHGPQKSTKGTEHNPYRFVLLVPLCG